MKTINVVIGLNYGDEGKGKITDLLARCTDNSVVVRFNGGCQAGHTVVADDGQRHAFGHFGSGTFQGRSTIFGRDFIVNPIVFWLEAEKLMDKVTSKSLPLCYADPLCPVTTPFDVFINHAIERKRGNKNHGSCGLGIGETMERHERGFPVTVADLQDPVELERLLLQIEAEYLPERLDELGIELDDTIHTEALKLFLDYGADFAKHVIIMGDVEAIGLFENVVFEGAQGLFLDAESKDFPYVTRSRTGLTNVIKYIEAFPEAELHIHYVSRTYMTRHGAGPLKGEVDNPGIVDKTNMPNEFQGSLRFAPLDFDRIEQAASDDTDQLPEGTEFLICLHLTHCDQNLISGESIETISTNLTWAMRVDDDRINQHYEP